MPLSPVYALTAVNCPALQAVGNPIWIQDGGSAAIGTRAESVVPGDTPLSGTPKLNRNAGRIDNAARYGGGAAGAILWGLGYVSDTGLSVTIGKGQAGWDSGSELKSDTVVALTDGVVNRLWLSEGGSLSVVTSASGTPLAPPDALTRWTYLMAVTCAGGVVTGVDYSGRLTQLLGNQIWRRTADAGIPGDTPPATIRFYTQTASGVYHWDGLTYRRLSPSAPTDAQYLVLALNPELTAERRFVPGAALVATDGGANADYTVDVNPDNATLEVASDALRVKALGLTDAHVAAANKDGAAGTASLRTLGTGATQSAAGNDSRLSDSRAPSGSAGGVLSGTYPNPGFAVDMATQAELDAAVSGQEDLAYVNTTVPGGNTINTTAAETAFASAYTFPGGSLAVGQVIRVTLFGVYGQALTPTTLRGKVKLGSVVVLDTGALSGFVATTNAGWKAEFLLVVTAIGGSGSVEAQGYASFATAAAAALAVHVPNTAGIGSIDFTADKALTVTITWGASDAANTITLRQMVVEMMG